MSDAEDDYFGADNGIDGGTCEHGHPWSSSDYCHGCEQEMPETATAAELDRRSRTRQTIFGVDPADHGDPPFVVIVDEAAHLFGTTGGPIHHGTAGDLVAELMRFCPTDYSLNPLDAARVRDAFTVDNPYQTTTFSLDRQEATPMNNIKDLKNAMLDIMGRLDDALARTERFGDEPALGTIIKFDHTYGRPGQNGNATYTYAALNTAVGWYLTGRAGNIPAGTPITWDTLVSFIGKGRAWVVDGLTEVPLPKSSLVIEGATGEADETDTAADTEDTEMVEKIAAALRDAGVASYESFRRARLIVKGE